MVAIVPAARRNRQRRPSSGTTADFGAVRIWPAASCIEVNSSLVAVGQDHLRTAMAMTVGLPLGISAKLILEGKIKQQGVMIPTHPEIYQPVLEILQQQGISFIDIYRAV